MNRRHESQESYQTVRDALRPKPSHFWFKDRLQPAFLPLFTDIGKHVLSQGQNLQAGLKIETSLKSISLTVSWTQRSKLQFKKPVLDSNTQAMASEKENFRFECRDQFEIFWGHVLSSANSFFRNRQEFASFLEHWPEILISVN